MPLIVTLYENAKLWLVGTSGISKDALHLYFALLIQLAAAQFFPRRLASIGPVLVIAGLELINEYFDYRHYHAVGVDPWSGWGADTARDVFGSLFLPLLLFALARFGPDRLLSPRRP